MHAAEVGAHALAILHGAGAALLVAAVLYLAGLALVPRRSALAEGEMPAVVAAAVYVLVCWFGVARHVPLPSLAAGFTGAAVVLALVRARTVAAMLRQSVGPAAGRWTVVFVGFYVLIYCFITPPIGREWLPLAWLGNIDVMTYIRYTQHFLLAQPWNGVGQEHAYFDYVYLQTPAVFYLHGALALFFGQESLNAAMPAAFAFAAWLAVLVSRISRDIFRLSWGAALIVGALAISTPFYRFIVGEYFLSSVMALPVFLFLMWRTVRHVPARPLDRAVAIEYLAGYVLLLMLYPLLLLVGVAVQLVALGLMAVADGTRGVPGDVRRSVVANLRGRAVTVLVPLVLLVTALFGRVVWSIQEVGFLSRQGIAGWAMVMISPWALLGWPGTAGDQVQCLECLNVASTPGRLPLLGIGVFAAIGTALLTVFWRGRYRYTTAQRAIVAVGAGAMLVYPAMFLLLGPSYQQWKFASYTAMPFGFVVTATVGLWASRSRSGARFAAIVGVLLVAGNVYAHAQWDPPLVRLSADLQNLRSLDSDKSYKEMTLRMSESTGAYPTWMALYFLPSKRVHVVSDGFRPREPLSYETITPQRPLLLDGVGCDGIGHSEARNVPGIGCLTLRPPSFTLDTPYPFNCSFVFLELSGFGEREAEGRWTLGHEASLTLHGDIRRVDLFDQVFVNLKITPYLPPASYRQRFVVVWGNGQTGHAQLEEPGIISIPVRQPDWSGTRVWTTRLTLTLPDALQPPWMYAPRGKPGGPPLAGLFQELSVTKAPLGTVVSTGPPHAEAAPAS
jgi:hypothetical protein